jgi:hypothetical protein
LGTDTSAFELLVLKRKIMGPCWLEIKNPQIDPHMLSSINSTTAKFNTSTVPTVPTVSPSPPHHMPISTTLDLNWARGSVARGRRSCYKPTVQEGEVVPRCDSMLHTKKPDKKKHRCTQTALVINVIILLQNPSLCPFLITHYTHSRSHMLALIF